ncbi:hypothetical protein AKO1_001263, partial [Acrasis kona]
MSDLDVDKEDDLLEEKEEELEKSSADEDNKSVQDDLASEGKSSVWSKPDPNVNYANEPQKAETERMKLIGSIFVIEDEVEKDTVVLDDKDRVDLSKVNLVGELPQYLDEVIEEELQKKQELEESLMEKGLGDLNKLDYCNAEFCFKETLGRDSKSVFYSQYVQWHNPLQKNRPERALMVLTRSLIYLADPNTFAPYDAVKIMDVRHIVQSGYEHDIIGIVAEQHLLDYNNAAYNDFDILIRFEQGTSNKSQDTTPDHLKPYDRKIEFFDQITSIYRKLKIHFVEKVESFTRMGPANKKEQQHSMQDFLKQPIKEVTDPIDPYDIIRIDERMDLAMVRKQIDLCRLLSNFGDKEILFTAYITKVNIVLGGTKKTRSERLFIVSDVAVYIFKKNKINMFQRRLPLEEISRLIVPSDSQKHLLICAPAEYDLYIISDHVQTMCHVLRDMYEDEDDQLIDRVGANKDTFDRHAVLNKTDNYRKKLAELNQYDAVMQLLRSALTMKQPDKLKVFLEYANRCRPDHNVESLQYKSFQSIKVLAEHMLKEIKMQDLIQERLQRAIDEDDVVEINKWFSRVLSLGKVFDSLKYYRDKVAKPKIQQLHNKRIILQQMSSLLKKRIVSLREGRDEGERELLDAFDFALRAGFIDQVNQNKLLYSRELQKINLEQRLKQVQLGQDADSLVLILEEARRLDIYDVPPGTEQLAQEGTANVKLDKVTPFKEQQSHMRNYIEHKLVINRMKNYVEKARSTNDHAQLSKELTETAKQYPWVTSNETYRNALDVVVPDLQDFDLDMKKLEACVKKVEAAIQSEQITEANAKQLQKYIDKIKIKMGTDEPESEESSTDPSQPVKKRTGENRLQINDRDGLRLMQRAQQTLSHVQEFIRSKLVKKSRSHRTKLQTALTQHDWDAVSDLLNHVNLDSYSSTYKPLQQLVTECTRILKSKHLISDPNALTIQEFTQLNDAIQDADQHDLYIDASHAHQVHVKQSQLSEEHDAYQNLRDALS